MFRPPGGGGGSVEAVSARLLRAVAAVVVAAGAVAVLAAVIGGSNGNAAPEARHSGSRELAVSLAFTVRDADRRTLSARLVCRPGTVVVRGYLRGRSAAALCARARRLSRLLTRPPSGARPCTQIYGGPQRARVRGSIGGRPVNRRFARRDGCEISDWDRAGPLLGRRPPPAGSPLEPAPRTLSP